MGFEAKFVVVSQETRPADRPGPQGLSECTVWADTSLTVLL